MSEALSDIIPDDYAIAVEDALAFPPYRPFIDILIGSSVG
jgi:hypothetical protein